MPELKNEFSWSKSRDDMFRGCTRKYYYNYYGSWGGWKASADRTVRQTYILKKLQSRHIWLGGSVHAAIEGLLTQIRYGHEPDLYAISSGLQKKMHTEFKNSERGLYMKDPKRYPGLREHEYNEFIPDDEWDKLFDDADRCITNFFNSDVLQRVKSVPVEKWLPIERLQSFDFEGTRVYVKIDLALRQDGEIVLFDWKTGKVRYVDMDMQLACYSLYAKKKWGVTPQDITCKRYNVLIDREDDYEINDKIIENVKDHMRGSIRSMTDMLRDKERNTAVEGDFAVTDNESVCRSCNFRRICPKWS